MCRLLAMGIALSAVGFVGAVANAAGPPECSRRLIVEFTPDVPNARAPGFLSSLLNDHPGYQLEWIGSQDAFHAILSLTGPGPASACQYVIQTIRKDGRVESLQEE